MRLCQDNSNTKYPDNGGLDKKGLYKCGHIVDTFAGLFSEYFCSC